MFKTNYTVIIPTHDSLLLKTNTSPPTDMDTSSDPVIASYDVYLTASDISRYVLQYLDRPTGQAYDDRHGQKPTSFRLKPQTGLVEVDVPISTRVNYDIGKGLRYGEAMKKSRSAREGGAYGMAGGFSSGGGGGGRVKVEDGDVEMGGVDRKEDTGSLLRLQTLGGRVKTPEDGDPSYMLAAFRGSEFSLVVGLIGLCFTDWL